MTFEGIAAVQARIQSIEQQVASLASPAPATATGSGPSTGADFASLLSDAMNTQTASGIGALSDSGTPDAGGLTGGTGTGTDLSSLVSKLTGTGTSTSPDLSSMISSLTGSGASTSPDLTSLISGLTGASGSGASGLTGPNGTTSTFLATAISQQGKPYVWGSTASPTDANPASFDCSELTKWAAARAGVTIPDGAAHQYVWLKEQGATMSVQQALQTPGALLFHFASEPQPGLGGEPPVAHVAISLGNGKTIEARGHAYGVGVFDATNRFNYAGMIPGMS
jgi:NlpC/P60 family